MFKAKGIAESVLDHFDSKFPREKSEKMDFKEVSPSSEGEGDAGEAHQQALEAHSEAMHEAIKSGDYKAHAKALTAFLHEHELHKEDKDVDNGPVSDEKDAPNKIASDEYK